MLPADPLRDWQLLGRSLELAEGHFAYYLVFSNWPEQNLAGKALLNEALQARGLSLQEVVPDDPEKLVETAIAALFRDDLPPATPLWLECWRNGSDPVWNLARRRLMARLNEGRGRLEKEVLRPLILLLPRDGVLRAAEDAPDMWSIRKLVVHLERPEPTVWPLELPYERDLEAPPTPEHLARAERKLAAWRKQWARAEAEGDMHILSLPDAWDATEALLEAGRLQDARTVAEQALTASRVCRDDSQPHSLRNLSISLNSNGEVSHDLGNLEAARAYYLESLKLCRQLREVLGDSPQVLRDLSVSLNNVGRVYYDLEDWVAARTAFKASLILRQQLRSASGDTPQTLIDLSASLDNIGEVSSALGELDVARGAYEESLSLRRQLQATQGDTPQVLRGISIAQDNVGRINSELGNLEAARTAYKAGLEISQKLRMVQGDTPQALRDLSISLENVGRAYLDMHDLVAAHNVLEECLFLRRHLRMALGDMPVALEDLARSLGHYGQLNLAQQAPPAARASFQEAADLAARLVALQPDHPGYQKLQTQLLAELDKLPP